MNILIVNGSPKGEGSNTYKLTKAFLDGLTKNSAHFIQTINISKSSIDHCLGCYVCWTKTPGKCAINDDMSGFLQQITEADLIIWSFPLYYFGMPSKIKAFLDRLLPMNLPEIRIAENGAGSHPSRYDLTNQRHVLISTCGFYQTDGNYDALVRQFEILFKDKLDMILCPEGELFRVRQLSGRIGEYLSLVKKAGEEYDLSGCFSPETRSELRELLYPADAFIEMANASWDVAETASPGASESEADKSYRFVRQMAATYNPAKYTKDICLEMHFTDVDKTYQLLLGKEKCTVKTEDFIPYTTRIETPYDVWLNISKGNISGPEAMMKQQYKTLGDFNTMLQMDELFASARRSNNPQSGAKYKKTNMLLFLIPFITLWIFLPIDSTTGALAAIGVSAFIGLLHFIWRPTPYERLGAFAAALIAVYVLISGGADWQIALPSFAFGIFWLTSVFLRIPLSAYYSCEWYGGESAYENPLFMKTNRILSAMWGIMNIILGTCALLIASTAVAPFWGAISNVPTVFLGIFTVWFSKWYPAKVARG